MAVRSSRRRVPGVGASEDAPGLRRDRVPTVERSDSGRRQQPLAPVQQELARLALLSSDAARGARIRRAVVRLAEHRVHRQGRAKRGPPQPVSAAPRRGARTRHGSRECRHVQRDEPVRRGLAGDAEHEHARDDQLADSRRLPDGRLRRVDGSLDGVRSQRHLLRRRVSRAHRHPVVRVRRAISRPTVAGVQGAVQVRPHRRSRERRDLRGLRRCRRYDRNAAPARWNDHARQDRLRRRPPRAGQRPRRRLPRSREAAPRVRLGRARKPRAAPGRHHEQPCGDGELPRARRRRQHRQGEGLRGSLSRRRRPDHRRELECTRHARLSRGAGARCRGHGPELRSERPVARDRVHGRHPRSRRLPQRERDPLDHVPHAGAQRR